MCSCSTTGGAAFTAYIFSFVEYFEYPGIVDPKDFLIGPLSNSVRELFIDANNSQEKRRKQRELVDKLIKGEAVPSHDREIHILKSAAGSIMGPQERKAAQDETTVSTNKRFATT